MQNAKMLGVLLKILVLLIPFVSLQVAADHDENFYPSVHRRVVPAANLVTSPYPEWAHYHW